MVSICLDWNLCLREGIGKSKLTGVSAEGGEKKSEWQLWTCNKISNSFVHEVALPASIKEWGFPCMVITAILFFIICRCSSV